MVDEWVGCLPQLFYKVYFKVYFQNISDAWSPLVLYATPLGFIPPSCMFYNYVTPSGLILLSCIPIIILPPSVFFSLRILWNGVHDSTQNLLSQQKVITLLEEMSALHQEELRTPQGFHMNNPAWNAGESEHRVWTVKWFNRYSWFSVLFNPFRVGYLIVCVIPGFTRGYS